MGTTETSGFLLILPSWSHLVIKSIKFLFSDRCLSILRSKSYFIFLVCLKRLSIVQSSYFLSFTGTIYLSMSYLYSIMLDNISYRVTYNLVLSRYRHLWSLTRPSEYNPCIHKARISGKHWSSLITTILSFDTEIELRHFRWNSRQIFVYTPMSCQIIIYYFLRRTFSCRYREKISPNNSGTISITSVFLN